MVKKVDILQRSVELFSDWRWRLDNLYWIIDKDGDRVRFRLNWAQDRLFNNMHHMNVILKARQLGFTTFIQIFMLDACLFNSNIRAGTIAHNLTDAKSIFQDKIRYPYDQLPEQILGFRTLTRDSANELALNNNSVIRVGTSLRSGTLQYLHISEYGKLCSKYPEKAREVRTGALNTIQAGQVAFIESTAEGQEGHFFEICEEARSLQRSGAKLSQLDFKFHFFPWWQAPEYTLDPEGVVISDVMSRYFAKLAESNGIELSAGQKAWYVVKAKTQLSDMKREYPSTPKEAFEASIEGAYYGELMEAAESDQRIGEYKADPNYCVHTAWDIGRSDYNSIWFWQALPNKVRLVAFFQNCGEAMPYYAQEIQRLYIENNWSRDGAFDWMPHDARVEEWGSGKSRMEQMFQKDLNPRIVTRLSIDDGIHAVRLILPISEFDQEPCSEGVKVLKSYRKEWNEDRGAWRDVPRHDWASHGADAFRTLAAAHRETEPEVLSKPRPIDDPPTMDERMNRHFKNKRLERDYV